MKKVLTTLTLLITLCSFAFGQEYDFYFPDPKEGQGYQSTMDIAAIIYVDGELQRNQDIIEIGVYCVEDDGIRGRSTRIGNDEDFSDFVEDGYLYMLYAAGEAGHKMIFKAYNHATEELLSCDYEFSYVENGELGTYENPIKLYFTTPYKGDAQIVETGEYFNTLAAALAAAKQGTEPTTVKLLRTTSGPGIFIEANLNLNLTIDFGGNTYTFTTPAVGSNGTLSQGLHIEKGNNITLQNGTLNVHPENKTEYAMLIQNYADLTITDMVLDGNYLDRYTVKDYNYSYVLSNNSGNVEINGNTNILASNDENHYGVAFDVCKYANYEAPVVTVNTTGTIQGIVEVSSKLNIEAVGANNISKIVIDGEGQLFHNGLTTTVVKNVEGTSTGWGTLSSPTQEGNVVFSTSTGHDFYQYNEPATLEWNNIGGNFNTYTMEVGRGYLYANTATTEVSFTGTLNHDDVNFKLSYTADGDENDIDGFNFIGNPFTHNITAAHLGGNIVGGYYVVGEEGTFQVKNTAEEIIAPFQAILVQATPEAGNLTIQKTAPAAQTREASNGALEIVVANADYNDVAYVSFNDGIGLEKIGHQNANAPLVYVTAENKNYAIAKYNKDVNEIPVSFIAKTMGQYTISVEAVDCEFNEMYLTDRMTGEKVNLLLEDYTFVATSNDNADRFVISFATTKPESVAENFIYMNNGNMIINNIEGNAVVRVLDVLGRPVAEYNVTESANISTATLSSGVYMIQMYDNSGVKVQKIVVE